MENRDTIVMPIIRVCFSKFSNFSGDKKLNIKLKTFVSRISVGLFPDTYLKSCFHITEEFACLIVPCFPRKIIKYFFLVNLIRFEWSVQHVWACMRTDRVKGIVDDTPRSKYHHNCGFSVSTPFV